MSQQDPSKKASNELLLKAGLNPAYMSCSVLVAMQRINEIKRKGKSPC